MTDILFLTVPKLIVRSPLLGPATLIPICEQHGYSGDVMDLNIDLWHRMRGKDVDHIWDEDDPTFMKKVNFEKFCDDYLNDIIPEWIEQIKNKKPKNIGISVLHQRNEHMAKYLIDKIIEAGIDAKIVLGAPYALLIGPKLLSENKIDAYVDGDAEKSIIHILQNDYNNPGINGIAPEQIYNLADYPFPDYSKHDLSLYVKGYDNINESTETLFINGARGCIKKCKFCDVANRWPMFTSKSGTRVADEIENYIKTYPNIRKFSFTDSLLNGDMKMLTDFCNVMVERNMPVTFYGQWITRPEQIVTPEFYDLAKAAGLTHCIIGIESGSQKIINDMKKGVRRKDIYYNYEQLQRVGIATTPLFLVGYPSETYEYFQETISLLDDLKKYTKTNTINKIALGPTCILYENTPVYDEMDDFDVILLGDNGWEWESKYNNFKDRIEWWFELYDSATKMGYGIDERSTSWLLSEYTEIMGKEYTPEQIANISRKTHGM